MKTNMDNSKNLKKFEIIANETYFERIKINSSSNARDVIMAFYHDDIEIYESFFILMLNRANITIGYAKISQGGITGTVVDKRIIFKYAIESLASSIILAHNHPSGNLVPSNEDITLTKSIVEGAKILDINIHDHLILSKTGYFSMKDEQII